MLSRICLDANQQDNPIKAYQKFMAEIVSECNISGQETCHMLQKLPLVICNRHFISLNVGKKKVHHIKSTANGNDIKSTYIQACVHRPTHLELLSLIDSSRSYTYSCNRKGCKWHPREEKAIAQVFPKFYVVPPEDSDNFELLCWSELLLDKHFYTVTIDIGLPKEDVITHWKTMAFLKYNV